MSRNRKRFYTLINLIGYFDNQQVDYYWNAVDNGYGGIFDELITDALLFEMETTLTDVTLETNQCELCQNNALTGDAGGALFVYEMIIRPYIPMPTQNKSLSLLADGFAQEFVQIVLDDDSFMDLLHTIAYDFVSENIPLNDEDMKYELGLMLIERTRFSTKRGV